jgi:quercetin dioxygenase-like cupin family protein
MPNMIVCQPAGAKQPYLVFECIFRFLATGEETGGSYSTMEILVPPGVGPDLHVHDNEEESFYIVEGNLTYWVGDQTFRVAPGDYVHIPRGTSHGFKNGAMPAKLIATFAPAGAEKLFQEAGEPVTAEQIARTMADESKYNPETVLPSVPNVAEDEG